MTAFSPDYDSAFLTWYETGPAEQAYAEALDEGEEMPLDAAHYRRTGESRAIDFDSWVDHPQGQSAFESWYQDETDPANRYDRDPRV